MLPDTKIEKEIRIKDGKRNSCLYKAKQDDREKMMWSWQECPVEVTLWQCSAF